MFLYPEALKLISKNHWKYVTPPNREIFDFAVKEELYLFGSRSMAVRGTTHMSNRETRFDTSVIRNRIDTPGSGTDFDFTMPYSDDAVRKCEAHGFSKKNLLQVYHPDLTMAMESHESNKSALMKRSVDGVEYQILLRRPEHFPMFLFVWDRISPQYWFHNIWKSSPEFIGKSIQDREEVKRLIACQMNGLYSLYLNNRMV